MNRRFAFKAFRGSGSDEVELGPNGTPTAFRIWKAGANPTDHVTAVFSERSAKLLMAEQESRGNLYSIDVDHLSLSQVAPPEARKAAGWHKLEVRNGDLWATEVQWTDFASSGLAKDPPEWRYYSPAFDVDKTGEVVSYLNTALTNNPATWNNVALATRNSAKGNSMTVKDILASLFGDDAEKRKETLAAMSDEDRKECMKLAEGGDEGPEKKPEEASEDPPAPKDGDDETKKAAVAATRELASQVTALASEVQDLRADKVATERAAVLASRKDLPAELVKTLSKLPLELMRETIAGIPSSVIDPAAAQRVVATRGDTQHSGEGLIRAARLTGEDRQKLDERFGRSNRPQTIYFQKDPMTGRNGMFMPVLTSRSEAHKILARRATKHSEGASK